MHLAEALKDIGVVSRAALFLEGLLLTPLSECIDLELLLSEKSILFGNILSDSAVGDTIFLGGCLTICFWVLCLKLG